MTLDIKSIMRRYFPGAMIARTRSSTTIPASDFAARTCRPASVESALASSAMWACWRVISQSIACLPGHVYAQTEEGKTKALTHPLYRALSRQPNAHMTFTQLMQTTVMQLCAWGNAFWVPQLVDGEVVALYPKDPAEVQLIFRPNGSFFYRVFARRDGSVASALGTFRDLDPLDILHFRTFSLDGLVGLSALDYHRLTIDGEAVAQLYAASIFANGGRPSGVLEYPGTLKKEQIDNIRSSWMSLHSGPEGAGSIAILEGGTKYNAISAPLNSMQYIEQQKFSVEQIARLYGVPGHLIGSDVRTPFASVEQQSLEFSMYTQQPIVTGIEQTVETSLLRPPFTFKLNLNAFQRADINSRYRAYAMGRQWGWFSVNDVRELEELNRIGAEGDVYLQPLNMIDAASTPTQDEDAAQLAAAMKGART